MIKVTGLQRKCFSIGSDPLTIFISYHNQAIKIIKTMKLPKPTEKPHIFCHGERFKSDWTLDVQSHWWHRTWLIAPVCGQHAGLRVCWWISASSISMKESMCPELHCTFHLEYCCVDHQVKKTVPGLHSCAISSAVVLAEQREGFERGIGGCDYPRFYLPYGSLWRRGNPSCWFD